MGSSILMISVFKEAHMYLFIIVGLFVCAILIHEDLRRF